MHGNERRRGALYVWAAVFMVVLVGMVGLAADMGYVHLVGQQLHNAADAGALAGAQKINVRTLDQVRQLAYQTALYNNADGTQVTLSLNESNADDGDIVIGRYHRSTRTFTPTLVGADAVKVVSHRPDAGAEPVRLLFGPVFGTPTARITRHGIAMNISSIGVAILILDPSHRDTLHLNGNSVIDVDNGAIQVNSSSAGCIVIHGTPDVSVSDLNVCATAATASPGNLHGNLNTGADYVSDPFAGLPFPKAASLVSRTVSGPVIQPGYYKDGIQLKNGSLRLTPGIYLLDGVGLDVTGGLFQAEGVLLCITGNNKSGLNLDLTGNGRISISPMTSGQLPPGAPSEYTKVSIYQDPGLKSAARIRGNETLSISGTVYLPSAALDVGGNGTLYGNQLIVNTLSIQGNSSISVGYIGDDPPAGRAFLVE